MSTSADPVTAFIEGIQTDLRENAAAGASPTIERRLLSTITKACRSRASTKFRERLGALLTQHGIHTAPTLSDPGLRLGDWVSFCTQPFPPDVLLFASEKQLQRFVAACLGSAVFRNLRPYRGPLGSSQEFRLPSGNRIDLLCEEVTRRGSGALVAIELKRERQRGTVDQLIEYLDALKTLFPAREVRGIVISGREDRVGAELLRNDSTHRIDWYCYRVKFEQLKLS